MSSKLVAKLKKKGGGGGKDMCVVREKKETSDAKNVKVGK